MATAALPYDGASLPALLGAMLGGRAADPKTLQPTLSDSVADAILQALRPLPEDRFASAEAFAAACGV
jgi:hypothetical protein